MLQQNRFKETQWAVCGLQGKGQAVGVANTQGKEQPAMFPVGVDCVDDGCLSYRIGASGRANVEQGNDAGAGKWKGRQPESSPSARTDAAALGENV